jgi:predicted Zn-dependent protease
MIDAATDSLFEGLDKNDEFSADALAVSYLNRVGYDYLAMSDVLNILNEKHKSDTMKVISKTHPSPEERQQQLQKAIRDMSLAATTGVRLKSRFEKHT